MSKSPAKATPGNRVAKVLARAGISSRRDAEKIIAEGRVRVNGKVIDSPALNIGPTDRVSVDGKLVAEPEPARLWLYHKPAGLVTTEKDEQGRQTVFESLPGDMPRVMSIGRLDITSEGLLVLTNDGEVKRKLELPSTGWLRRYRVRINGSVSEERLDQVRKGITVDGVEYAPMGVNFDRQQGANAWLTCTLKEGKNREIRRTMEAIGVVVNRLIRISYGPFQLGNLKPGEVEELKPRVVRDQLGLDTRPQPSRSRKAAGDAAPVPTATATRAVKGKTATMRPGAKPAFGKAKTEAAAATRYSTAPLDPAAAKPKRGSALPFDPEATAKRPKSARDKPARAQGALSHSGKQHVAKPKSDAPETAETKRFRLAQADLPAGETRQVSRKRRTPEVDTAEAPKMRRFTPGGTSGTHRAEGFRSHSAGPAAHRKPAAAPADNAKPKRFGKAGGFKSHHAALPAQTSPAQTGPTLTGSGPKPDGSPKPNRRKDAPRGAPQSDRPRGKNRPK